VTVLSVARDGVPPDMEAVLNVVAERDHELRTVGSIDAVEAILDEAKLGFGVIGLGVSDVPEPGAILSAVADSVIHRTSLPLVVVRRAKGLTTTLPGLFAKALVPVSGTRPSRAAQEVAFNLAAELGTEITLLHVVSRADDQEPEPVGARLPAGAEGVVHTSDRVLEQASGLATELGATSRQLTRRGVSVADEIINAAAAQDVDLVVLGADPRQLDDRAFLGHTVEEVLARCAATVVVVTVPPESGTLG
jgi:nucleotide-binding universal stress UspA family protein